MIKLKEWIQASGKSQAQVAEALGVTQPRVSDLVRGRIDRFSLDSLFGFVGKLGWRVDMSVTNEQSRGVPIAETCESEALDAWTEVPAAMAVSAPWAQVNVDVLVAESQYRLAA
jgi:transcriptional regulator with XRE-family HTH domain